MSESRQLTSEFGEAMMVNLACQLGQATMPKYFRGFCEGICYGVNVCVPPHSYVEALIHQCGNVWRWASERSLGQEGGALMMELLPYKKRHERDDFSLSAL